MSEVLLEDEVGEGLSIRDYWLVLQRHRILIVVLAIAVTVAAVLFSATRTPIYQSRSELLVSSFQLIATPSLSPSDGGGGGSLATELRLITSAPVRDRVAAQLGLAPSDPRLLGVSVSQLDGTNIVVIVATDRDPVIAASVSNAYATAYLDSRRDRVLARVVTARRAIDEEITDIQAALADVDARIIARQAGRDDAVIDAREELRALERDLEDLILDREELADDPASRLASVQGRIIALETRARSLELQLRDVDADLTALAGNAGLVDARLSISERRATLTAQRDALGTRSSIEARIAANSPATDGESATRRNARRDAEDALRQWDSLNGQIDSLSSSIIEAADLQLARDRLLIELSQVTNQRNQLARDTANLTPAAVVALEQLDAEIAALEADIAERQSEIDRALSRPTIDLSSLTLERDVLFSRLSAFIGQRAGLVEDASGLTEGGEVLVRGSVPTQPISPRPARTGVLALIVGLAMGVGIAFARDYLEDAIRDDLDVRRATSNRPLLGRIPEWIIPGPSREGIVTLLDPSSVAAESYRELSANVRFMALTSLEGTTGDTADSAADGAAVGGATRFDAMDATQRPPLARSIMMVSATANNGKTATAVNLAVASARAGQRVVIVDADLRRPRVAALFGLGRLRGLSDLLAERGEADDYLVNVGVPNLLVLPAGTLPPNPADVLANIQLDVVHQQLKDRFDLIIYDTPAVLAVPDALEVGRLVDWGLLVMQHTVSTRREVTGTIQRLEQVGVPIEGGVLNAIDTRSDAYYYYYTYYHRLEYGASPEGDPAANGSARVSGPRVPVGPGGPGAGAGLGTRDRVLVPAARPRGGVLRRLGLFDQDDVGPSRTRDRRGGAGAPGPFSRFSGLLGRDEDVTGEFDDDEPRDA